MGVYNSWRGTGPNPDGRCGASRATATRDLQDLMLKGALSRRRATAFGVYFARCLPILSASAAGRVSSISVA